MASENEVIEELTKLVGEGEGPRDARLAINKKFPDWDDRNKLKKLISRVEKRFPAIRKTALRKTEYFKIFLIGSDNIRARGKKLSELK